MTGEETEIIRRNFFGFSCVGKDRERRATGRAQGKSFLREWVRITQEIIKGTGFQQSKCQSNQEKMLDKLKDILQKT